MTKNSKTPVVPTPAPMELLPPTPPTPPALSVAIGSARIELPGGVVLSDRVSKAGKMLGTRMTFTGDKSASDLRAEGKASGLKGNALSEYVNSALRGDVVDVEASRNGRAFRTGKDARNEAARFAWMVKGGVR